MEVNPMFPAKTVPEFIAYAKANPGKINMATAGSGSMLHVYGELFKMMAGVDMVPVPYRGAPPAVTDLIGGRVQVKFVRRVRQVHRRGHSEMGQGGEVRGHQAGLIREHSRNLP
jgi:hypothetical protein